MRNVLIDADRAARCAVCAIVRNEEYDIAEWITYQISIGFHSIVLFDNGSDDRTKHIIDIFSGKFEIFLVDWPYNERNYQINAYNFATEKFKDNFDWILFCDVDEFLVIKSPSVLDWLNEFRGNVAQVLVNWVAYGSSGHDLRPKNLVLDDFTLRAPDWEAGHRHTKALVRPKAVLSCGNPHWFSVTGRTVNTFGEDVVLLDDGLPETFQDSRRARARIHHYWTKSREQWIQKNARGYHDIPSRSISMFESFDARADIADHAGSQRSENVKRLLSEVISLESNKGKSPAYLFLAERYRSVVCMYSSDLKEENVPESGIVGFKYKYSVVVCARWEDDYIYEWLTYYRAIGFDHVYLYCNDDEPFGLYEKIMPFLAEGDPFVTFVFWNEVGAQFDMYFDFLSRFKHETEYVSFLDVDEFLRLPSFRTIGNFLNHLENQIFDGYDCVYFNWCMFGNSGYETRPSGSVIRNYVMRERVFSNFMTKHITKTAAIDLDCIVRGPMADFWHYWDGALNFDRIRIVNVFGENVHSYYDEIEKTKERVLTEDYLEKCVKVAVVNHYAFKSREDFILRARRSVSGVFSQQVDYERAYHDGRADQILERLNAVEDVELCDFWDSFIRKSCAEVVGLQLPEFDGMSVPVSQGKPAIQSSISQWSSTVAPEREACEAVNGVKDGSAKFHTALEDCPWWMVDLLGSFGISEIRIFNRLDSDTISRRSAHLAIDVGLDTASLIEVYRREADEPFGGVDGNPLIFKPAIPIPGRCVRVRLLTESYLHLDQVEVYGEPLPLALHRPQSAGVDAE